MKFKYTEIKDAYLEVKKFLEHASGEKINSLNTKIVDDLKLWGDDNYFLLIEFIGLKNMTLGIIKLPVLIINSLIIKYISLNTYNKIDNILYDRTNEKIDLTFGDLILSKLKGEFCLRDECKVELAK